MVSSSLFTKIINRELPADIVHETESIIVIKDIHPQAPLHFLIIPKKSIQNIQLMEDEDFSLAGEIFKTAQYLSRTIPGAQEFKLVINNGHSAGQRIFHMHVHFLAGTIFGS